MRFYFSFIRFRGYVKRGVAKKVFSLHFRFIERKTGLPHMMWSFQVCHCFVFQGGSLKGFFFFFAILGVHLSLTVYVG